MSSRGYNDTSEEFHINQGTQNSQVTGGNSAGGASETGGSHRSSELQEEARLVTLVAARLAEQVDWDSKYFTKAFLVVLGIVSLLHLLYAHVSHTDMLPGEAGLLAATFHSLVLASQSLRKRCRLPEPQLLHSVAVCLDVVLCALANAEVQLLLGIGSSSQQRSFGQPKIGNKCPLQLYSSALNTVFMQAVVSFFVLFVLTYRCARATAVFSGLVYVGLRVAAHWQYQDLPALYLIEEVFVCSAVSLVVVSAKRKSEATHRALLRELFRQHDEVVQEKIKRCQAEFEAAAQNFTPQQADTSSEGGSTTHSSTGIFQGLFDCDKISGVGDFNSLEHLGRHEHWVIDPGDLRLQPQRVLGVGGFGVVGIGTFLGSPVAVKLAKKRSGVNSVRELANELRIFRHVRHPNIALFHGACFGATGGAFAIILELVNGSNMEEYLSSASTRTGSGPSVGEPARWALLVGISRALTYLHTRDPSIVHGDLKPSNMMVEHHVNGPRVKLLDFGLSRLLSRGARPLGGTSVWMAPEAIPSAAADTYSFGRVTFFVATGRKPEVDRTVSSFSLLGRRRAQKPSPLVWPNTRFARRCETVASRCLIMDPKQRPKMGEIQLDLALWPHELDMAVEKASAEGAVVIPAGCDNLLPWTEAMPQLLMLAQDHHVAVRSRSSRFKDRFSRKRKNRKSGSSLPVAPLPVLEEHGSSNAQEVNSQSDSRNSPLSHLTRTPRKTQRLMLLSMILRWHCPVSRHACCDFHEVLGDIMCICRDFRAGACRPNWMQGVQEGFAQCPKCFAVDEAAGEEEAFTCDACNYEGPDRADMENAEVLQAMEDDQKRVEL